MDEEKAGKIRLCCYVDQDTLTRVDHDAEARRLSRNKWMGQAIDQYLVETVPIPAPQTDQVDQSVDLAVLEERCKRYEETIADLKKDKTFLEGQIQLYSNRLITDGTTKPGWRWPWRK
jgi:hypothetical protein